MDAKLFRLPSNPNLYPARQGAAAAARPLEHVSGSVTTDSRFPGWAAPMSDAQMVTDYRAQCSQNIPAGLQVATHAWLQKNAKSIITVSRARQSEMLGANLPFDASVVPPPASIVSCDAHGNLTRTPTGLPNGIGEVRQESLPHLFGTFNTDVAAGLQQFPPITREFAGGRNTPRGRQFVPLGTKPLA